VALVETDIPDAFVAFMEEVLDRIEEAEDDGEVLEGDDALQGENGYGGRSESDAHYEFVFFPPEQGERWRVNLTEEEILDIADGRKKTMRIERAPHQGPPPRRAHKSSSAASLGERLLEALLTEELIELSPDAMPEMIARELDREVAAILDDVSQSDLDRAASIAELLERLTGVDEVFGTDEDLLRVARSCDE